MIDEGTVNADDAVKAVNSIGNEIERLRAALTAAQAAGADRTASDWDRHYEELHAARYDGLAEGKRFGFTAGIEAICGIIRKYPSATADFLCTNIRALSPPASAETESEARSSIESCLSG